MYKNRFQLGLRRSAPTPLGELTALPILPSWNKGDLFLREGGRGR